MSADRIVIIFSGYNDRAVISFVRTLEKNKIRYSIIARDDKDQIFKTLYRKKVDIVRESHDLDVGVLKSYINTIMEKHGVVQCLIAPSSEALNRFLLKEIVELRKMNVVVPLSEEAIYTSVSDKKSFGELCKKHGISVPYEYNSIDDAELPFVAKPKEYVTKDGKAHVPFLIFNENQKKSFIKKYDSACFYFQKFVTGDSQYLLYYFHRNGEVFRFSQKNIAQQPNGRSIVAAVTSDFYAKEEADKYDRLFINIGFSGLVMVELKIDGDTACMIEANPRFWGPSQLFVDANMNFFEALLHDYDYIRESPDFKNERQVKYFWFGGFTSVIREGGELSFYRGDETELLMHVDDWLGADVFKRSDTIGIFKEEIK